MLIAWNYAKIECVRWICTVQLQPIYFAAFFSLFFNNLNKFGQRIPVSVTCLFNEKKKPYKVIQFAQLPFPLSISQMIAEKSIYCQNNTQSTRKCCKFMALATTYINSVASTTIQILFIFTMVKMSKEHEQC